MSSINSSRRHFLTDTLKFAGASAAASLMPASILRAQSIAAASATGTIQDVKHIVILMQENRSFDHYLGNLPGVRGFGDPRPVTLAANGYPVWYQPSSSSYKLPFRPTPPASGKNSDVYYAGLDHTWGGSHAAWNLGRYDSWVSAKGVNTMAYFTSQDIPFYYSLANAFTVCDAYHCSLAGPTNPNRLFMFTGCNGNIPGQKPQIGNDTYGSAWTTFPERLNAAGITWKFYQDKGRGLDYANGFGEKYAGTGKGLWWSGNYGDNTLLNFRQYQNLPAGHPLSPALNGTQIAPNGDGKPYDTRLFDQLRSDVANNTLPQVSWIAAPVAYCEHPSWATSGGEWYVSNVLNALTSNPDVWASTVFLVTYDENDGFFDHVPPPVPPTSGNGKSNVSLVNEFRNSSSGAASDGTYSGDQVIGFGARVPMWIISPWSKGGKVNSQVFDHTSIIRFIEARFGFGGQLFETNISPWRRAVSGDLTSAFDFANPNQGTTSLGTAASAMNPSGSTVTAKGPGTQSMPALTTTRRQASRLPYEFFAEVSVDKVGKMLNMTFTNTGTATVSLHTRQDDSSSATPKHFTLAPDGTGRAQLQGSAGLNPDGTYAMSIYGPNGYLHQARGSASAATSAEARVAYDVVNGNIRITLDNKKSTQPCVFMLSDNAYPINSDVSFSVAAGASKDVVWYGDVGWYDVSVRADGYVTWMRRFAGCVQPQSKTPMTDSAIGNTAQFKPKFTARKTAATTVRFDYATPPWLHSPKNWIGVYKRGVKPGSANSLAWAYTPYPTGSVEINKSILSSGEYDLYFLFNGGYTVLSGPYAVSY